MTRAAEQGDEDDRHGARRQGHGVDDTARRRVVGGHALLVAARYGTASDDAQGPQPRALWAAALVAAACLGLAAGDRVVEVAADDVYREFYKPPVGKVAWQACVTLFRVAAVVGIVRLGRGWWGVQLLALALTATVLSYDAGTFAFDVGRGRGRTYPFADSLHGWPYTMTAPLAVALALVPLVPVGVQMLLLLRPEVRAVFRRARFLDGSELSHAFPVVTAADAPPLESRPVED